MTPGHCLLALATVIIWGFNFVVITWGLRGLPPVLFTAMRFICASIPLVFFLPRPRISWRLLAGYAFFMFVVQFTLLFVGMKSGMPAGLSSLVIQLQVFFTIGLATAFLGDRPRITQLAGAIVALAGMVLVGVHIEARGTSIGFAMVLAASLSWATGNLFIKRIGAIDPLALVAWGSLLAAPCLLAAALALEGPRTLWIALTHLSRTSVAAVLFQAYPTTVFGFGAWSFLMRRYPTATIAPFALLVPVFGILSGTLFLGEPLTWWKVVAGLLVIGGLAINQFGDRGEKHYAEDRRKAW